MSVLTSILDTAGQETEIPWYTNVVLFQGADQIQAQGDTVSYGDCWGRNGYSYYQTGATSDLIRQWDTTTPYSLTGTNTVNLSISATDGNIPRSIRFNSDGTRMYLLGDSSTDRVFQYDLSTAWYVNTATYNSAFFDVDGAVNEDALRDFCFSYDGTKMFVIGAEGSVYRTLQFTLSTAWDVITATYDNVALAHADLGYGNFDTMLFDPTGYRLYMNKGGELWEFEVREAFNISTVGAKIGEINRSYGGNNSIVGGFDISPDGRYMIVTDTVDDSLYRHIIGAPE